MQAETITVDGVEYKVNIVYPTRLLSFEILEGKNSGVSLSHKTIRDIGGTKYNYSMQIKAQKGHQEDFDALFDVISAPVESHRVIMPYGQTTLEFDAAIRSGSVTDYGSSAGQRNWSDLEIYFEALEPQRRP